MSKACKEVFHPCAIETKHIIMFLLVVTQFLTTTFLTTKIPQQTPWHCITVYLALGACFTIDNRSQDSHCPLTQMHVHKHTTGLRYLISDSHNV